MRKVSSVPCLLLLTGSLLQPGASVLAPERRKLQQQQGDDWEDVTPASTTTSSNSEKEDIVNFFNVSFSYVVLLPGAVQYDIPLDDYSSYLIAIMDGLVKESLEVFDPDATLEIQGPAEDGEETTVEDETEEELTNKTLTDEVATDDLNVESPTEMNVDEFQKSEFSSISAGATSDGEATKVPMPNVGLQLPTSIERFQNLEFSDTPALTDQGVFVEGPCPSSLGNKERDRCVQVTASSRALLFEPETASAQVVEALKSVFEMAVEKAIGAGRLHELLVEQFPWTDMVVLSGYNVSSDVFSTVPVGEANSTRVVPQEVKDKFKILSLSITTLIAILIGLLLLLALIVLVAVRICCRSRQNKEIIAKNGTEVEIIERTSSSSLPQQSSSLEAATGLEWGPVDKDQTMPYHQPHKGEIVSTASVGHQGKGEIEDGWTENPSASSVPLSHNSDKGDDDKCIATPSNTSHHSSSSSISSTPSAVSSTSSNNSSVTSSKSDFYRFRGLVNRINSVSPIQEGDESIMVTPENHRRTLTVSAMGSSNHDLEDESTATSLLDQSIDSDVATVDLASGAVVIMPKSIHSLHDLKSHLSPMDVKDFDALEAAILVGDWNTIAAMGNEADSTGDLDMSAHSYGTMESAAVYRTPIRNGERRLGTVPWNAPDGSKFPTTSRVLASQEEQPRTNAWQAMLDAAKSSELAHVMSRGDWASVLVSAAKHATVDVPAQKLSLDKEQEDEVKVNDGAQGKLRTMTEV